MSGPLRRYRLALYAVMLALLATGCLEPVGNEQAGYSPNLLPPDAKLRSVEEDEGLRAQIDNNDGLAAPFVALHTGYAGGAELRYWDFGVGQSSLGPLWRFRRMTAEGVAEPIDHPDLIDSVPGDSNYTSLRSLYTVLVTRAYRGEQITSLPALEDAVELGLIEEPVADGVFVNWPVVLAETELEIGDGAPTQTPVAVYYRGRLATLLQVGTSAEGERTFPLPERRLMAPSAYVLRRQNEAQPLDEGASGTDFNQDGDMQDSNVVFAFGADAPGYRSVWTRVEVIVGPDYSYGASRAESDLFERSDRGIAAIDGALLEYAVTMDLLNRPIRPSTP